MRRSTTAGKKSDRRKESRGAIAEEEEEEEDAEYEAFTYESFGYLGPGGYDGTGPSTFDDVRELADEKSRHGKGEKTSLGSPRTVSSSHISPLTSANTTPQVRNAEASNVTPVTRRNVVKEQAPIGLTMDAGPILSEPVLSANFGGNIQSTQDGTKLATVTMLNNRAVDPWPQPAFSPVGFMAELCTEFTARCEEEINPAPVELPDTSVWPEPAPTVNWINQYPVELPALSVSRGAYTTETGPKVSPKEKRMSCRNVPPQELLRGSSGQKDQDSRAASPGSNAQGAPTVLSSSIPPQIPPKLPANEASNQGSSSSLPGQPPESSNKKSLMGRRAIPGSEARHVSIPSIHGQPSISDLTHFPSVLRPGQRRLSQPPGLGKPIADDAQAVQVKLFQPREKPYVLHQASQIRSYSHTNPAGDENHGTFSSDPRAQTIEHDACNGVVEPRTAMPRASTTPDISASRAPENTSTPATVAREPPPPPRHHLEQHHPNEIQYSIPAPAPVNTPNKRPLPSELAARPSWADLPSQKNCPYPLSQASLRKQQSGLVGPGTQYQGADQTTRRPPEPRPASQAFHWQPRVSSSPPCPGPQSGASPPGMSMPQQHALPGPVASKSAPLYLRVSANFASTSEPQQEQRTLLPSTQGPESAQGGRNDDERRLPYPV